MTTDSVSGRSGALGAESMEKDKAVGVDNEAGVSRALDDDDEEWEPDYDPRDCDCIDAELDWEGTFHCYGCGRRWYATKEQMDQYWAAYEAAHRPPTWHERMDAVFAELKRIARRLWPVRRAKMEMDDDIPF